MKAAQLSEAVGRMEGNTYGLKVGPSSCLFESLKSLMNQVSSAADCFKSNAGPLAPFYVFWKRMDKVCLILSALI